MGSETGTAGPATLDQGHSRLEPVAYRVRYLVNAYPALYLPLARIRHRHSPSYLVGPATDLVIEAFGRAGSTFANFAFLSAQTRPVRTAHHTHAAAQVIAAVRMGIPTLVIVRPPAESALSHMVRHGVSADAALAAWVRFHRRVLPYRSGFVVASFAAVTADFGHVIGRLNDAFGTRFDVWEHTPENESRVFEQIRGRNRSLFGADQTPARRRSLSIPTAERAELKRALRSEIEAERVAPIRRGAEALYTTLTGEPVPSVVPEGRRVA